MTSLYAHLVPWLAGFLEPAERTAILGDFAEISLDPKRSSCELCALLVRRQLMLWKDWRPWLALLGIVGLVGARLNFLAGLLATYPAIYLRTYYQYGTLYHSGLSLGEELCVWLILALAVIFWSWLAGFVLLSLSQRTVPLTLTVAALAWLVWHGRMLRLIFPISLSILPWLALTLIASFLFLAVPALAGARSARHSPKLSSRQLFVLFAAVLAVLVLVTWTSGWPAAGVARWSEGALAGGPPWYRRVLPYLLLSWPAAYLFVARLPRLSQSRSIHR